MEAAVEKRGRNRGEPAKSRTHLIADTAEEAFSESGNGEEWRELAKWQGARGRILLTGWTSAGLNAHKHTRDDGKSFHRQNAALYFCTAVHSAEK